MTKHDAHVLKFKMQFFPIKLFTFIAMFFFTTGMLFGSFLTLIGVTYGLF